MATSNLSATLKKIAKGEITREEAATTLACSERQVNRLMRAHGVQRPVSPVHAQRAAAAVKREKKTLAADEVLAGHDITRAAKGVCSVRTLYRLVEKRRKSSKTGPK